MYLVGIDVGTTNTKTVIFDVESGQICAVGNCRSITRHPVVEWSEYDEIPGIHGWNPWCMETGWLVNEAACR